ncbi:MAG: ATP synthase F1 subunit gamma [bacterium]
MATLKVIRKRIGSVKNTQKITKAMKMVSAARLRRAQTALYQARPYEKHLQDLLKRMAAQVNPESSPYLQTPASGNPAAVMVFSSNRGLCGGFNSNLLRRVQYFLNFETKEYSKVDLMVVGRKGRDFFRSRKVPIEKELNQPEKSTFAAALEVATEILKGYEEGKFSAFYVAYNGFKSAISQEIRIRRILPLELDTTATEASTLPVIYKPSALEIFNQLVPRYVASQIHLAHLESQTSELGARMSAMENATSNAKEMISLLTLQYNRARQALITKELMDIVNGAESLK